MRLATAQCPKAKKEGREGGEVTNLYDRGVNYSCAYGFRTTFLYDKIVGKEDNSRKIFEKGVRGDI